MYIFSHQNQFGIFNENYTRFRRHDLSENSCGLQSVYFMGFTYFIVGKNTDWEFVSEVLDGKINKIQLLNIRI